MKFRIGDVVRLKCGGAYMVVSDLGSDDGRVMCEWQNKTAAGYEPQQRLYHGDTLMHASNEQIDWVLSHS